MTHPLTKIRAIIDSPPFTITKQPNPYETPYIPSSQLQISSFDADAIKVDNSMLLELNRLQQKFDSMHSQYLNLVQ